MKKLSTIAVIALLFITNITFAGGNPNVKFRQDLAKFTRTFFDLEVSIVKNDTENIQEIASKMIEDVEMVNMSDLNDADMEIWHNSIFQIKQQLAIILTSTDLIKRQDAFNNLASSLLYSINKFDVGA